MICWYLIIQIHIITCSNCPLLVSLSSESWLVITLYCESGCRCGIEHFVADATNLSAEVYGKEDCLLGWLYERILHTKYKGFKNYVPSSFVHGVHIDSYARGGLYVLSRETLTPLLIGARHISFITHLEDVTVGNALYWMGIRCERPRDNWIARYGCFPEECGKFVSIHPNRSSTERLYYHNFLS